MQTLFRQLVLCLLWLWLPFSYAADTGWLRAADNDHASIRLRAEPQPNGDARLLLDVALEKGWKTYWRSPGKAASRPPSSGKHRWRWTGAGRCLSVLRWRAFPLRATTATSRSR